LRTVARYSIEAPAPDADSALSHYLALSDRLTQWLAWKGELRGGSDCAPRELSLSDGRQAALQDNEVVILPAGAFRTVVLTEPPREEVGAWFETTISVAVLNNELHVYASLRAGGVADQPLAPVTYDAHCPRFIRDCIGYNVPWTYGGDRVRRGRERLRGRSAGESLASVVIDQSRMLPLVVVSELSGFTLHPGVAESLGQELLGLAHVVQIDDDAAWALTRTLGAEWSCFNGAIRLYWPRANRRGDPFVHPLWTSRKLLEFNSDTRYSAERLCNHLRRRLAELSAFTVREPAAIAVLIDLDRARRFAAERANLESASDFRQLAESYLKERDEVRGELEAARKEIESLRSQVDNLSLAVRWKEEDESKSLLPDVETPPATVKEAVDRVATESAGSLRFGNDVAKGVEGLFPQAGPPEKVRDYLRALAELSSSRQSGPLGTSMLEWLKQRNISGSQESETTKNSNSAKARRTFHDGDANRYFEWHLKPNESTSPDRCVRIYFDWLEDAQIIVVGWVGRHPG
jgi:hypothetical protein